MHYPRKWSPRTVHGRIIGPPGPDIAAIPGPPLRPTVPHAPVCNISNCLSMQIDLHNLTMWNQHWNLNFNAAKCALL